MKLFKIILVAFVVFAAVPAFSAEWVQVLDTSWYFDKTSISVDKKTGVISFWQKHIYPNELLIKIKDLFGKSADFSNYENTIGFAKVNCESKTLIFIKENDYSKSGGIINSMVYSEETLKEQASSPVTPETEGEMLLKEVCKTVSNNKKTKKSS